MPNILLKILIVIGICLLILVGILLFVLLLVLFVPITYQIRGEKNDAKQECTVRAKWLLGFLCFPLINIVC